MSRIDKAIEMAAGVKSSMQFKHSIDASKALNVNNNRQERISLDTNNNLLVAANDSRGALAEEYNKLHALIDHMAGKENRRNTLMITSAVSGEGKTLTAVNLALTMSRTSDQIIILVDSDLRRPSICGMLNIRTEVGLSHCLGDNVPFEDVLTRVDSGNLVVLPAGQTVDNPLELISSNRMQRLIGEIKERYPNCYCIFDSPPVLPFADARVMGTLMDGTVFVVRENYSRLSQIKEGLGHLHGCDVLGILCNDSSRTGEKKYGNYY